MKYNSHTDNSTFMMGGFFRIECNLQTLGEHQYGEKPVDLMLHKNAARDVAPRPYFEKFNALLPQKLSAQCIETVTCRRNDRSTLGEASFILVI